MRRAFTLVACSAIAVAMAACGTSASSDHGGGGAADGGAGQSGTSGTGGASATGGSAGTGAAGGNGGNGGGAGTAGSDAGAGAAGSDAGAGAAGSDAGAGAAGSDAGVAGAAGTAGTSGTGGAGGSSGTSGAGGTAGSGGSGGTAGSGGSGGVSGSGGSGGSSGSGACISGATGAYAARFQWTGSYPGSTAYVVYEANNLPDTSRWHVSAASTSFSYTPIFDDTYLGPGGLDLEGTAFIDVELSTAGLSSITNVTIAIYGRSFNTTASGSFNWQTFAGTGASPYGGIANSTPYEWYPADATSAFTAGDGNVLLRLRADGPSGALIVDRVEICFDAS